MTKTKRIRWADVYRSNITGHAKLIVSILLANGLNAKVQRKKLEDASSGSIPYVLVPQEQLDQAQQLLTDYGLGLG